jgi:hypothetical protein
MSYTRPLSMNEVRVKKQQKNWLKIVWKSFASQPEAFNPHYRLGLSAEHLKAFYSLYGQNLKNTLYCLNSGISNKSFRDSIKGFGTIIWKLIKKCSQRVNNYRKLIVSSMVRLVSEKFSSEDFRIYHSQLTVSIKLVLLNYFNLKLGFLFFENVSSFFTNSETLDRFHEYQYIFKRLTLSEDLEIFNSFEMFFEILLLIVIWCFYW